MMKPGKTFGETIRNLREQENLTLSEVAGMLKIDTSTLGKIEKNSRNPSKKLIKKLAKIFKVSEKDLTIAFLSDTVAYRVLDEEAYAGEVLKAAEKKIKYSKTNKNA